MSKARVPTVVSSLYVPATPRQSSLDELFGSNSGMTTSSDLLGDGLKIIGAAADEALNSDIPMLLSHGKEVRDRLNALANARSSGDVDTACFAALKLCEAWMKLRTDAVFSAVVSGRRRQLGALPKKTVSDDDIESALRNCKTQTEAANKLGIDERQIRNRIPMIKRKTIKADKNRK